MEKRLALALVLCLIWIILAQQFFFPAPPPESQQPQTADEQSLGDDFEDETSGADRITSDAIDKMGADPDQSAPQPAAFTRTEVAEESLQLVDTHVYQARFLNRGAVLESLKFKKYFTRSDVLEDLDAQADPENWLEILRRVQRDTPSFGLREMSDSRYNLDQVLWEQVTTQGEQGETVLAFSFQTGDGLIFKKTYTLYPDSYHIDLDLEVSNQNPELTRTLNLIMDGPCGITDRHRASFTEGPMGVIYASQEGSEGGLAEITKVPAEGLKDTSYSWIKRGSAALHFSGVANNYFALLVKPLEGKMVRKARFFVLEDSEQVDLAADAFRAQRGIDPPADQMRVYASEAMENARADFQLGLKIPPVGETASQSFMFFAGPKSTDLMQAPPYQEFYTLIEESYGNMAWINTTLIWILNFFHGIFSNWGVAIICLTFVVKALLFPLSRVQQVSMQSYSEKMKRLKPKLDELKKKFKNNKKKFNEAQMNIMKEEGVRPPLMGCLLLFLQLPIFFGLFQILRTAFDLRHSPFIFWVQDLSQPDAMPIPFSLPFLGDSINVLPILMTVAFYYQQKMMPKPESTDPQAAQMQKIMRFMPIIFGVMFYTYASGLSLYWMTSNIITIMEYKIIRKKWPVGGVQEATAKAKNSK